MGTKLTQDSLIKILDDKLKPLLTKIDKVVKSVEFLSSKYDELEKVNSIGSQQHNLHVEINALKQEVFKISNELKMVKKKNNDLEQYTRRDCLEIRGIPTKSMENTNEIVRNLGSLIDVNISPEDISTSHRLPKSNKVSESAIIAKFTRRDVRDNKAPTSH